MYPNKEFWIMKGLYVRMISLCIWGGVLPCVIWCSLYNPLISFTITTHKQATLFYTQETNIHIIRQKTLNRWNAPPPQLRTHCQETASSFVCRTTRGVYCLNWNLIKIKIIICCWHSFLINYKLNIKDIHLLVQFSFSPPPPSPPLPSPWTSA